MTKFLRTTAAAAALLLTATPALAAPVGPSDRNATATARIVKPLTLTWVQDLNLGTVLLSGAGAWAGAVVSISRAGAFSCANANVVCSGANQVARYNVTGTNNQTVTITAPGVTLVNQNDNTKTLPMSVDSPGTVALSNSGNTGVDFSLGGSITVASTTTDGVYLGTFNVTVDY
ncbi:DUF4402 domain-containing protein [Sphingomonas sp.]|uniref:DUF4402 domain-containing protein n=1 Tax=Sphingomonas sp. TaxID=28214 RepID=UPI00286E654D|nr:DUF4402 domain-containing protein [Sphingomonas sp.]